MGAPLLIVEVFDKVGDSPEKQRNIVRKTMLGNQFQAVATGKQKLSYTVPKGAWVAFCIYEHLLASFDL